jgi:glycosyltransferase involved in cell wall biosynthesis
LKNSKTFVIIVLNSARPSAVTKIAMRDIYSIYANNPKILLLNTNKKTENFKWFNIFFKKSLHLELKFVGTIFFILRQKISYRLFSWTKSMDLAFSLICLILFKFKRSVLIINHDFTRQIPNLFPLSIFFDINIKHVFHSYSKNLVITKKDNCFKYIFANEHHRNFYVVNYDQINFGNSIVEYWDPLTNCQYLSKLNYSAIENNLSVNQIKQSVKNYTEKFTHNFVYFGRLIDDKGIKEFCDCVAKLNNMSISFSIFGSETDWFNSWFYQFSDLDNIKYFGGSYIDIENVLFYFDYNILLSSSEVFPLSLFESLNFGIKSIVLDRPFCYQIPFVNSVIIFPSTDLSSLTMNIEKLLK